MLFRLLKFFGVGSVLSRKSTPLKDAKKAGTFVTVTNQRVHRPNPTVPVEVSMANGLMKRAVQLKKEKHYDEACSMLREAFEKSGNAIGFAHRFAHRLRLPSYLVLAGKNDEAWRELNRLNIEFVNPGEQSAIGSKMALILRKEGRFKEALIYGCWSYSMEVKVRREFVEDCITCADNEGESAKTDEFAWLNNGRKANGKTPAGNPIYDCSYPSFAQGLRQRLTSKAVIATVTPLLKKAGLDKHSASFVRKFRELLKMQNPSIQDIRELVSRFTS